MEIAILMLRGSIALMMIVFGFHELRNPESWVGMIPDELRSVIPISRDTLTRAHAFMNIIIGLILISGAYLAFGAWFAFLWIVFMLPFSFHRDWQAGVRELVTLSALGALIFLLS